MTAHASEPCGGSTSRERRRLALVVVATLIGLTTCVAQDKPADKPTLSLPDDARATLTRLLRISNEALGARPVKEAEADRRTFIDLLAVLGSQIRPLGAEERARSRPYDIEQAIVAMALDRVAHPERYDEILYEYTPRSTGSLQNPVALRPKRVEPRHASEAYRLVWESLLLEPPSGATVHLRAGQTVTEALARIRDDRSIPVLVHALGATSKDRAPQVEQTWHRQAVLLETLGRFATRRALDGLLEVLALCQGTLDCTQKFNSYTVREWAFRLITDQENLGNRKEWLEVLEQYRKADLSIEDRSMLERAIAFQP